MHICPLVIVLLVNLGDFSIYPLPSFRRATITRESFNVMDLMGVCQDIRDDPDRNPSQCHASEHY